MLEALKRGDRVVTSGGIVGNITKASETELTVEIADGIKVKVMRGMISDVLAKTEARDNSEDSKGKDEKSKD